MRAVVSSDVRDAPPHPCAAPVAFAIGPLPQPQDRAGGASSGNAAHATARRTGKAGGKRISTDTLLQGMQDRAEAVPCSSSHAVEAAGKGCTAVEAPHVLPGTSEGEGGSIRVACQVQEPSLALDQDTSTLRHHVSGTEELCSDGRTLISV